MVEIAALGKPLEIHNKDEMAGYNPPAPTREIAMGDQQPAGSGSGQAPPPSLRKPGEAAPPGGSGKVQFPTASQPATPATGVPASGAFGPSTPPHLF